MNNQFSPIRNPFATAPWLGGNGFWFQPLLWGVQKPQTDKEAQSKTFPWLPLYMERKINDYAFQNSYNETQRSLLANDLYKEALKQKAERDMNQTRQEVIRESYARSEQNAGSPESNQNKSNAKALEVVEMIRGYAKENGAELGGMNDMQVLQDFVRNNPETQDAINNYLAGDQSATDFAETMGFTPPVPQENWVDGTLKSMGVRNVDTNGILDYFNPIGKAAERIDDKVQGIQGWGDTSEREAQWKERIAQITPEERKRYEEKFANSENLQSLYGSVDNYIAENKKGFWDHFWWVGESGPAVSKMIANAPVSALKTLSGTARAITNPLDSITGIVKILGSEEGRELLKQRYGENLDQTMNDDPVGLASDILAIIQAGAGIGAKGASLIGKAETASKLAGISQTAGTASDLGANLLHNKLMWGLEKVSNMGKVWNVVGTALEVSQEPLRILTPIGKGLMKALPSAEHTLQNMNRLTKGEQSAFQKMTGVSQGQWMNERWLIVGWEEAIEKLGDYFLDSKKKVDDAMGTIQGNYKNDMLDLMLEDSVRFAKDTLNEGLERVSELQQKAKEIWLTMSEINEVKRFYEQNNKLTYGKDITAGEKSIRATNIDNAVREWQIKTAEENGFDNLREMNKETQASKFLLDKLVKNENGRLGNNYFTLTDYITGVGATVNPSMLTVLVGKKIANSNWFRKGYVKVLNKINGAETISEKLANIEAIKKIQNEKDLNNYLALEYKEWVENTSTFLHGGDKIIAGENGSYRDGQITEIDKGLGKLREWAETKYQLAGQTTSDNFKKWFGDWEKDPKNASKVVDFEGKPLVVYHSSNAKRIRIFNTESASWFTPSEVYSKAFSEDWWKTYKAYLNIKNPIYVGDIDGLITHSSLEGLSNLTKIPVESLKEMATGKYLYTITNSKKFKELMIEKWYDGIEAREWGVRSYWVFGSSQIKSATDNIWAFDVNNPDIRYQKHGVANPLEKDISAQRATQIQNIRNGKSVEQIAKDYGVDIKIVDKITTPEGLRAYGKYSDGIITLAENIKEGTAPHELFHATFDLVDSSRKENILRQIEKSKGLDSLNAEEYLADSFSEYFRTGKFDTKTFGKGLVEKIKQYFYQVKQFITGANKNKAQIKKLFDEILDGEIDRDMLGEVLGNKKETGTHRHQLGWPRLVPVSTKSSIMITAENASIFTKKLSNLNKVIKDWSFDAVDFLDGLKNNLNMDKKSGYLVSQKDWVNATLRISDHYANARNHKVRGYVDNNTSIVIKLWDSKFRANGSVDLVEFVYNPENLTPEKMQGIIKGVQDWIDTGEYTDKGYDHTHKSIRATLENGEVKYQRVYHGSPYEFDKFDSAHMGKGEGAQAHWWGHYVAVDKKTGERYARTLPMPKYQGKSKWQIPQWWVENSIISNILQRLNDFASIKDAIEKEKMLWNWYEKNERIERGIKFLDEIKESDFEYQNKNLYEVEIPDPVKSNTPTWNNYLEKEWSIKKDALNKIYDELYKYHRDNEKLATFKKRMDNWNIVDWETLQDSLSFVFQDDKAVSKFLESLWYDGIHYYWGIDWESYVIFDDNKLEIKNRSKL